VNSKINKDEKLHAIRKAEVQTKNDVKPLHIGMLRLETSARLEQNNDQNFHIY